MFKQLLEKLFFPELKKLREERQLFYLDSCHLREEVDFLERKLKELSK